MANAQHDLAEKLNRLISGIGNPSTERLAEAIKEHTGTSISGAYLWQLKKGKRSNLTLQHLMALASYFTSVLNVPVTLSYFDPSTPVDQPWLASEHEHQVAELQRQLTEEKEFTEAMGDHGVRRIAQRLGRMDAAQRRQFLAIADAIAGMDEGDPSPGDSNA